MLFQNILDACDPCTERQVYLTQEEGSGLDMDDVIKAFIKEMICDVPSTSGKYYFLVSLGPFSILIALCMYMQACSDLLC